MRTLVRQLHETREMRNVTPCSTPVSAYPALSPAPIPSTWYMPRYPPATHGLQPFNSPEISYGDARWTRKPYCTCWFSWELYVLVSHWCSLFFTISENSTKVWVVFVSHLVVTRRVESALRCSASSCSRRWRRSWPRKPQGWVGRGCRTSQDFTQ